MSSMKERVTASWALSYELVWREIIFHHQMTSSSSQSAADLPQIPEPVLQDGLSYWEKQSVSYDGVLGGYGSGALPRVESLGSRTFLLYLFPELSTVPSAVRPLKPPPARRFRALDVGAGIGRVTSDTLLPLVSDVVLLEPIESLIQAALSKGRASATEAHSTNESRLPLQKRKWKGIADGSKSVTFLQGTLQDCDPANPTRTATLLGRVGYTPPSPDDESGFDVVWCQWCLIYMKDTDLIAFLKRSQAALRKEGPGVIVVKDNVCQDGEGGVPEILFDEKDSSVTRYFSSFALPLEGLKMSSRSDLYWKMIFRNAGLSLLHERVQYGLPKGLYMVKMYALK
ncbi:AdoMet dependent proline di-methyltransferase-domain-containing protein [Russula earlei]|uniref:AdoMet dependent proline di-methyltransferase-domain-containing protein n=1 Tax=Russula earlei TaxID=71964 RepID=A0ACC0U7Q3_9AGAM|nr:AdoMet dependent proline di-methyltransferase-domain-containing protein [Russula earlei]